MINAFLGHPRIGTMAWWSSPYRRRWILWGVLALSFLLVTLYRLSTAVIADDTKRADETEMIKRWREMFPDTRVVDCNCEKGCILLEFHID